MVRAWEKAKGGRAEMKMTVSGSLASAPRISLETGEGRIGFGGSLLHQLDEHVSSQFVGLVAGGDADHCDVLLHRKAGSAERGVSGFFLVIVGEFGE